MAPTFTEPHTILQSWVRVDLVEELKARSRAEGCSLSSLVRDALEDSFARSGEDRRTGGSSRSSRRGAGQGEER